MKSMMESKSPVTASFLCVFLPSPTQDRISPTIHKTQQSRGIGEQINATIDVIKPAIATPLVSFFCTKF